jgi:hypothetical protein
MLLMAPERTHRRSGTAEFFLLAGREAPFETPNWVSRGEKTATGVAAKVSWCFSSVLMNDPKRLLRFDFDPDDAATMTPKQSSVFCFVRREVRNEAARGSAHESDARHPPSKRSSVGPVPIDTRMTRNHPITMSCSKRARGKHELPRTLHGSGGWSRSCMFPSVIIGRPKQSK